MAKNKTTYTTKSVIAFVSKIENETKRDDSFKLIEIFKSMTGVEPKMWGPTIIGFGSYHYTYESGLEGDAPLAGFSPRKDSLVLYFSPDYVHREVLLSKLGTHKSSKACVYVKKLSDIDIKILEKMIVNSMTYTMKLYPSKNQKPTEK